MPGIAVTCDAEIAVVGTSGARTFPAADFFVGRADDRAEPDEIITDVRLPPWPTAGAGASRNSPAARRFRPRRGCGVLRPGRERPGDERACRRHRRRRPAPSACRRRRVLNGRASTTRRSPRPRRPPRRRSIRPTISTPAPPIGARWSALWSSARSSAPPGKIEAMTMPSSRFEVNGARSTSTSRRA